MKQRMLKVSAKRGGKKGKGKLHHINLMPAENGFTAEHHFAPPESADGSYQPPPDPETHVMASPEEMGSHVSEAFGGNKLAAAKTPAGGGAAPVAGDPEEEGEGD